MVYQTSGGAQWPILAGSIDQSLLPVVARLVLDADGEWAVTDEPGTPDGYVIVDVEGDVAADSAASSGQRLIVYASEIMTY